MIKRLCLCVFVSFYLSACSTSNLDDMIEQRSLNVSKSYYDLGLSYLKSNKYDLAKSRFYFSLRYYPLNVSYNALAYIYEILGDDVQVSFFDNSLNSRFPNFDKCSTPFKRKNCPRNFYDKRGAFLR